MIELPNTVQVIFEAVEPGGTVASTWLKSDYMTLERVKGFRDQYWPGTRLRARSLVEYVDWAEDA